MGGVFFATFIFRIPLLVQIPSNNIILFIAAITIILLFLLSFIAAVLFLHQKKILLYHNQLETAKNTYEKNLLQTQLEIQEQTFRDIAREIHDNIGLSLTLAKLRLNTLHYTNSNKTREDVQASVDLISKAVNDLSDISKGLNPDAVTANGLYNTLKAEMEKIRRSGKYKVEFVGTGAVVFLDANKELILYRIAQEALNNVLKHAGGDYICLRLVYDTQQVTLSVEDNGCGFNINEKEIKGAAKMRSGLINIYNRSKTLRGHCTISSNIGKGTIISVTIPC